MVAAHQAEAEIVAGDYRGPLHGIPFVTKDLFWTKGVRTTSGSRADEGFVPDEDATVVRLLQEAGACVNLADNTEWTPLHIACQEGHTECCGLLIPG